MQLEKERKSWLEVLKTKGLRVSRTIYGYIRQPGLTLSGTKVPEATELKNLR